jgi:hypothetical protein
MAPKKDDKKAAPKKAAGSGGGKAKKKVCRCPLRSWPRLLWLRGGCCCEAAA